MKKNLLAASIAVTLGAMAPSANAAFTTMGAGNYSASITGGCFTFGTCSATGTGAFTDNNAGEASTTVTAAIGNTSRSVGDTVGSGTVGGTNGTIIFSLDAAGNMSISSYAQDSYLATAGGTFYVDALGSDGLMNTGSMTGNINTSGDVSFTPTGRVGTAYDFYTGIGSQPWNITPDDAVTTETAYDTFTSGTDVAIKGKSSVTLAGSALQDTGTVGEWSGVIVSAGNVNGQFWSGFDNTLYSEIFELTITCTDVGTGCDAPPPSAVPVPAAVWLFGSGLLGLVGVARRRKSA